MTYRARCDGRRTQRRARMIARVTREMARSVGPYARLGYDDPGAALREAVRRVLEAQIFQDRRTFRWAFVTPDDFRICEYPPPAIAEYLALR